MGGGMIRIGFQGGLVMRPRLGMAVGAKQEIAEVHMRHRIIGMMQDRLGIDAAGGIDRALRREQRAKFVERAEMGRVPAQNIDERRLRVLAAIERAEQRRALDFDRYVRLDIGLANEQAIELAQPRFLREAGSPLGRGSWFGLRLGHGLKWAKASRIDEFARVLSADSRLSLSRLFPFRR
jgi:hypothetical protein